MGMDCERLMRVAREEEQERILGIIEYLHDEMGTTSYENYAKKVLRRTIQVIEHNT